MLSFFSNLLRLSINNLTFTLMTKKEKEMAKTQAIEDIQEELNRRGKIFIVFIKEQEHVQ